MILKSIILSLFTLSALAQVKTIDGLYGVNTQMETNYIKNKGCYQNTNFITASVGTLTRNTTNPLENGADCQLDASATAQTFSWDTYSLDGITSSNNCEAKFSYRGDASLYKAYVQVNGIKVTNDLQLINSQSPSVQPVSINFPCGAQPLPTRVVIESTSASAAAINVAGVYVGLATNLSNISQASFYGGAEQAGASGCTFLENTSSGITTFVDLGTGTGCSAWSVAGAVSVVGTNDHRIVLQNLPVGEYKIEIQGYWNKGTSASTGQCFFRLSDGTTTYQPQVISVGATSFLGSPILSFHVSRTSPSSSVTYRIQASDDHSASCGIDNSSVVNTISWKVYRFPSASEIAIRPATSALQPAGEIMAFAAATCPTGWLATDGTAVSRSTYAQLFSRIGTAHGSGDGSTTFNLPDYRGRFLRGRANGSANDPDRASRTAMATGGATGDNIGSIQGDTNLAHNHVMFVDTNANTGTLNSSAQYVGRALQIGNVVDYILQGSATVATVGRTTDTGGNESRPKNAYVNYCIRANDQTMQAPIIVGSVTSNTSGAERIERAVVTAGATCTLATDVSQSGNWITSCTRNSAGDFTLGIAAGTFSATPSCNVTVRRSLLNTRYSVSSWLESASTTSIRVIWALNDDQQGTIPNAIATVDDSGTFHIQCMGPR